ncbi:succinylglutamate desuccinylase/aspartoacylase domain-containing protein [Methanobrevibacter filiformis]|nr:succinylglutamate desuccinylase/aspartoacylase family protein [Methanobrevibacter filiformis]
MVSFHGVSAAGTTETTNITTLIKNVPKITTLKWKTGGDVKKNYAIKKSIPKSKLVNKVVKDAKYGTPIVRFGNGSGKKVFIVAGVHGNEIASQIAALKLIQTLEKKKYVKGTIYIIPFTAPWVTAHNSRFYKGKNLNSVANEKNTVTNKIINLAKNYKVVAVGDFHCTQPGGVPGRNIILGTKIPNLSSANMAKGIAKIVNMPYKNEKYAAVSYPGALEDNLSVRGIPAVTCEVKIPHGTINKKATALSLRQMNGFLKYNKLL